MVKSIEHTVLLIRLRLKVKKVQGHRVVFHMLQNHLRSRIGKPISKPKKDRIISLVLKVQGGPTATAREVSPLIRGKPF